MVQADLSLSATAKLLVNKQRISPKPLDNKVHAYTLYAIKAAVF